MIKIEGLDVAIRNINLLKSSIVNYLNDETITSLDKVHEKAMNNIDSTLKWGHSIGDDKIRDSKFITSPEIQGYSIKMGLGYNSNHAAIVELGGTQGFMQSDTGTPVQGFIDADNYGHKGWPVGKSQGKHDGIHYPRIVKLQDGKHYLSNAMNQSVSMIEINYKNRILREVGSMRLR